MHPPIPVTLAGQVALISGAASGIGRATALLFAQAGARVAALDQPGSAIERTAEEIQRAGGLALPLVADISQGAELARTVAVIEQHWGRLDLVVANAGINGMWAPVEEITEEEWERTHAVNLKGTFLTVKHTVPLLKRQGGAIVVVSSVNGTRMFSSSGASAYATSKGGQLAFARMIALELAPHRIRVNTVCPGSTQTGIFGTTKKQNLEKVWPKVEYPNGHVPLTGHKLAQPEQVAGAIWYLCSPFASHVTGTEIYVDGGESLLKG